MYHIHGMVVYFLDWGMRRMLECAVVYADKAVPHPYGVSERMLWSATEYFHLVRCFSATGARGAAALVSAVRCRVLTQLV